MTAQKTPPQDKLPILFVVCAVFQNNDNEILLIQRPKDKPMPGLWEFPGGKIEFGETPEQALIREIKEEIALKPTQFKSLAFVSHSYATFHIILLPYLVTEWSGELNLLEQQQGYIWVDLKNMKEFSKPAASEKIIDYMNKLIL